MTESIKIDRNCSNCGKCGHTFKQCKYPISSYGIVNVNIGDKNLHKHLKKTFSRENEIKYYIVSKRYTDIKYLFSDKINFQDTKNIKLGIPGATFTDKTKLERFLRYKDKIMFQMVSRKHSLGFSDFMRGKYDVFNSITIIHLFKQMYPKEIEMIKNNTYDNLLYDFLNIRKQTKEEFLIKVYEGRYSSDYCDAKVKYDMLISSDEIPLKLDFFVNTIEPLWTIPEWGFPKGRRNIKSETDLTCACREFEEETGYQQSDYHILNKIEPFEEYLTGTNGVPYRHVYYVSVDNVDTQIARNYDTFEIGEIKWFTFQEAINVIRPYHVSKKQILTNIYLFILNSLINNVNI